MLKLISGAVLDRNGLRPSRFYVTNDKMLIMASEVGVYDVPPENVILKSRLKPGRMLLVDTEEKSFIQDIELKTYIAKSRPHSEWLKEKVSEKCQRILRLLSIVQFGDAIKT